MDTTEYTSRGVTAFGAPVHWHLRALPHDVQRGIIRRLALSGLQEDEIAARTGLSVENVQRHRKKLLKNATELGQYFLTRLSQMSFNGKATVHGKGFAIGIEAEDEDYASEIGDACRENGLLVSAEEDVLMLFPALTIARQTAQRGLDIFERCL